MSNPKIIWGDGIETEITSVRAKPEWMSGATRDVLDIMFAEGTTLSQAQKIGKTPGKVETVTVVSYAVNSGSVNVPETETEMRTPYTGYKMYGGVYDDESGLVHLKLACEIVQQETILLRKIAGLTAQNETLQDTVDSLVVSALEGGETE